MELTLNKIYMGKQQSPEGSCAEVCLSLMAEPQKQGEMPYTFSMTIHGLCPHDTVFGNFVSSK